MSMANNGLFPTEIWGGPYWDELTKNRLKNKKCLERYGYKVFSQNDEDGILQEIFKRIGTTNKTFVEFGVQDGLESNCHYLLYQNWNGLFIEGDEQYYQAILEKFHPVLKTNQLKCRHAFITKDNINQLISDADIQGPIDLLSIDIDGNDYYVWEAIHVISPRVVVIEYNGKFPPDLEWKMAYKKNHIWDGSDWHSASLKALENLGRSLGYQLAGSNYFGANAFFVQKQLAKDLFCLPATAEALYNPPRFYLTYKSGHPSRYCLLNQTEEMGVFDYQPHLVARPLSGFYPEENNASRYCWAAEKRCTLEMKQTKGATRLKFSYFTQILSDQIQTLTISVDGKAALFCHILQEQGELEIPLPPSDCPDTLRELILELAFLWRPSEHFGTTDTRPLGIAILLDSFQLL